MLTMLDRSPYEIYCEDSIERESPDEVHEMLEELHGIIYNSPLPEGGAYLIERNPDTGRLEGILTSKQELKLKMIEQLGGVIQFGRYPQASDIPEPITWRIIDIKYRHLLLISERVLDCQSFRDKGNQDCDFWKDSTLRKWLNHDFLQTAFNEEERRMMEWVKCRTQDNKICCIYGGGVTEDKVCLLNIEEAKTCFSDKQDRKAKATAHAIKNGVAVCSGQMCEWWLRVPGRSRKEAAFVDYDGIINEKAGRPIDDKKCGVRPVIMI